VIGAFSVAVGFDQPPWKAIIIGLFVLARMLLAGISFMAH
jgi:hypothetical protein